MSEIKLVISDLDDTLAPHMSGNVSEANKQAVIDVENNGIQVAIVTGRAYNHAKNALDALGIDGPCVFDGGATIAESVSGKVLWRQWLSVEITRRIFTVLREFCSEAYYTPNNEMVDVSTVTDEMIHEESPCIFALTDTKNKLNDMTTLLSGIPGIAVYAGIGSHPVTDVRSPAVQITHSLADKFHGVEALRRIVDVPFEQTLAIGDGDNDVPLFANAGLKIAMGNASSGLKAKADHVIGTLEQDGFSEAMNRFVLSERS